MVKIIIAILLLIVWLQPAIGNDVRIRGEAKVQAITENTALITFPLSWEHSWRESESWDAVYLFVKYRRVGVNEPWHHAYLKEDGHRVTGGGNVPAMEFLPVKTENINLLRMDVIYAGNYQPTQITSKQEVAGVFLFRRTPGNGNLNIPRVSLEWDFKQGDLNLYYDVTVEDIRQGKIEVSVQAVEMVYVPNGPYYLGDRISPYSFVSEECNSAFYVNTDDEVKVHIMGATADRGVLNRWVVPDLYPTGYTGFYTMKYEVSQEQYVNFLNRITYTDQKKRIGNDLDNLAPGQFAFGKKDVPNYRNGIILQERFRTHDTAVIFGFDLNGNDPINSDADGKSVACNYLTPDDVRAYCDWAGLRPHSEMEYEKGCRQRNPAIGANDRSFAWGTPNFASLQAWNISTVKNDNAEDEEVLIANAANTGRMNGPKVHNLGPVRCGAFATETSDIYKAGASKWGIMEMTGNLAEIYYNARQGKNFNGEVFGDGNIWSSVASWRTDTVVHVYGIFDVGQGNYTVIASKSLPMQTINKKGNRMTTIVRQSKSGYCGNYLGCRIVVDEDVTIPWPVMDWPAAKENFILKGGSFASEALGAGSSLLVGDNMAVSYRGDTVYARALPDELRYAYSGFRGGRSVPMKSILTGKIEGQGGRNPDTALICAAQPYVITEVEPGDDTPASTVYLWEMNDEGTGWEALPNSNTQNWTLNTCLIDETLYHTYKFRRQSIASHAESYGNEVTVVVPGYVINGGNSYMEMNPYVSSVTLQTDLGIAGDVKVEWRLESKSTWHLLSNQTGVTKDIVTVNRTDLTSEIPLNDGGACKVRVTVTLGACTFEKILDLAVRVAGLACPATVTDNDGNSYAVAQQPDGRCWMMVNSKVFVNGASTGGLYTWKQIQANGDNLCPPGFAIPTKQMWDVLWRFYATQGESPCGDPATQDYVSDADPCSTGYNPGLYAPGLDNFMAAMGVPPADGNLGGWWLKDLNGWYVNISYDTTDPYFSVMSFEPDATVGNPLATEGKHPIRCYKK